MAECWFCGEATTPLFRTRDYRRPDDRKERELFWCAACRFGRLQGNYTPDEIASFYPSVYYTHGTEVAQDNQLSFLDRLRGHLAWRLDAGTPLHPDEIAVAGGGQLTFCDLGCGSGEHLQAFKNAGYAVIGVEPDFRARSLAEKVGVVLDGTAEELPPELLRKQYDVVLMSHVFEHCIDPIKALSNVQQILAPRGTLVIEVPNNDALGFATFHAIWPWTDIPRHLNFFTEHSLRIVLAKCGYEVTKTNYVGYTRQFQAEWIKTQEQIWAEVGRGRRPDFKWAAWLLLLRTSFAEAAAKYDSIRIHAVRSASR